MIIHHQYIKQRAGSKYYVYQGTCDGIDTKWITINKKWDFKVAFVDGKYVDSSGAEMIVCERGDEEWNLF